MGSLIHVSKIGCVNIPCMDSHYPRPVSCVHPHQCQQFHQVSSADIPTYYILLCHCDTAVLWAPPVEPRSVARHQVHDFCAAPLSREIQGCFAWEPQLTFELTPSNTSHLISSDQHSHWPLFTWAHGYPRRIPSANVKDKDELQNYLFQQNVLH